MSAFGASMAGSFMGAAAPGTSMMYGNSQMGMAGGFRPSPFGAAPMGYGPQGAPYGAPGMPYGGQQQVMGGVQPNQTGQPGTAQMAGSATNPGAGAVPLSSPPPAPQPQKLYVQTTAIESAATMAATAHISFLWTMIALTGGVALGLSCGLYRRFKKGKKEENEEKEDDDSSSSSSSDSDE